MTTEQFRNSIVAVGLFDPQSGHFQVFGSGLIFARNGIITCAHVIANAVGTSQSSLKRGIHKDVHGRSLAVVQPFVSQERIYLVKVVSVNIGNEIHPEDLASLEILGDNDRFVPESWHTKFLKLSGPEECSDHRLEVYGFPSDDSINNPSHAVYTSRNGVNPNGWIHLIDSNTHGEEVREGFSGAPVWDDNFKGILGIISVADPGQNRRTALMIPVSQFYRVCPQIRNKIKPAFPRKEQSIPVSNNSRNHHPRLRFRILLAAFLTLFLTAILVPGVKYVTGKISSAEKVHPSSFLAYISTTYKGDPVIGPTEILLKEPTRKSETPSADWAVMHQRGVTPTQGIRLPCDGKYWISCWVKLRDIRPASLKVVYASNENLTEIQDTHLGKSVDIQVEKPDVLIRYDESHKVGQDHDQKVSM